MYPKIAAKTACPNNLNRPGKPREFCFETFSQSSKNPMKPSPTTNPITSKAEAVTAVPEIKCAKK